MKKFAKALVGGLIICMVLCSLFPSAFLEGDAKWTFQNDLGRVDVTFVGDAHNGQIDVTGKDLQLDRPRFYLDDKGNQGVVIQFPVSYVKKAYQLTLKPRGNAKDISLALRFRGKNFLVHNQRKPAYVRYENVRVNGKSVAEGQTVWHDQSLWYRAKKISDNSTVTLDFDIRKPFSSTDINWERVIDFFVLCSLFVFFSHDVIRKFVQSIIEQKGVMLSDVGRVLRLHKQKILILAILTLLANILCIPLWTELGYGDFVWSLFNKETRLDLLYQGKTSGEAPFQLQSTPQPLNDPSPYFMGVTNRQLSKLNFRAQEEWQKLSLQLKSQRSGKITLALKGPRVVDDYGHLYSVLADWRNLRINGKVVFNESKTLSYQRCFSMQIPVKENETLHVEAEFRRHHFTTRDFTFLKSGNIWYLITGNLLFFFLIYRLQSCYAARRKNFRPSDALLVGTFFTCLFIPMMNISDEVGSQRENRMLAVKPKLEDILSGNLNTGGEYEKWFDDHFFGRTALIKLHDVIQNGLSLVIRAEKAIYFKENGWDFLMPLVSNLDYRLTTLQAIVQNLLQLDLFCRQNKIQFYVLEVPQKESVYKGFLSDKYGFDEKKFAKASRAQETIRSEVREHHIPYVYPYEALRDATKQDFVFFKCSHHWTDWGAFVGYRELMEEVRKDFPDMALVSLNDYQKSSNWLLRDDYLRSYVTPWHFVRYFNDKNLATSSARTFYNYYDHKNGNKMMIQVGEHKKDFAWSDGKHKIMLIGTSQNENLLQFLPYSAAQTKYIRLNMPQVKAADQFKILKLYKKDILAFKPDILVLSITTDNLPDLRNLFSTK